ncbi:MAG: EthD domain-containing protein [Pseudomonadota bacterium]
MLKLMIVGRRRGGMTVTQLHRYMLDVHGTAVVAGIATDPGLMPQRYVQNHVFDSSFRGPGAAPDPFAVARDFVTQVWFESPAQAAAATQTAFYLEQLQPDEDNFVDQASVVKLPVAPEEVFTKGSKRGSSKLFVFHQRASGVAADVLAETTLDLWKALLADAGHGIDAVVRNRVLQRPGDSAPADVVDEVWLADEAAARSLGEQWQALFEGGRLKPLLASGSGFVLLARENVLFAGSSGS